MKLPKLKLPVSKRRRARSELFKEKFFESRHSQMRREHRSRFLRSFATAAIVVGTLALLAAATYLLFFSRQFTLQSVVVDMPQKVRTIQEADIESIANASLGENLLFVDADLLARDLKKKYPRLRSVEVKKLPPNAMKITAEEFERFAFMRQPITGLSYVVNENGAVIQKGGESRETDVPLVVNTEAPYALDDPVFSGNDLPYLQDFLRGIRSDLGFETESVKYFPTYHEARIQVKTGPELWIDFLKSRTRTLKELTILWRSPQLKGVKYQYIDLRLPNGKVVYREG